MNSPRIADIDESKLPEFEISKDPKEWAFVEQLMPSPMVPMPKVTVGPTPSGWVPPRGKE